MLDIEKSEKQVTIRIPIELHEALRWASFKTRKSIQQIGLEALELHPDVKQALKEQGRE